MPPYAERKREEERQRRIAAGESLWTDELSDRVRWQILYALSDTFSSLYPFDHHERERQALAAAQEMTCREQGVAELRHGYMTKDDDAEQALLHGDTHTALTLVEHICAVLGPSGARDAFMRRVNAILRREWVSVELVEGEFVDKASQELHDAVVAPTVTLLSGRPGFEEAERAYQAALKDLHDGEGGSALTHASTALQTALKAAGCSGKTLGDQFKDAKKKGYFAGTSEPLQEGIRKVMVWVAAERNTRSTAHQMKDINSSDAWLMVHVVGALILWLAASNPDTPRTVG